MICLSIDILNLINKYEIWTFFLILFNGSKFKQLERKKIECFFKLNFKEYETSTKDS